MGFLDYAWSLSLQRDKKKTNIRLDRQLLQPVLTRNKSSFNLILPVPRIAEDGYVSFLGSEIPAGSEKTIVGRLFRACVFHLTAHSMVPNRKESTASRTSKCPVVEAFAKSLVDDVYVNSYISTKHPEKLADLAFANSFAFTKMKSPERIFNSATRIMAALLLIQNVGITKGTLSLEEERAVSQIDGKLNSLKGSIRKSLAEAQRKDIDVAEFSDKIKREITGVLESHRPILEIPSLPHTDHISPHTLFSRHENASKVELEKSFKKSLEHLNGVAPIAEPMESCWKKEIDIEATQAFDSWFHQKTREQKVSKKIEKYIAGTHFKSSGFPDEDYGQYLKSRVFLRGGSRRLLDSLRVAQDALDEDPRKEVGQLDMTEVIQKIASQSPRTDVFMQNEYLSRSYAWGILFDASASMKINDELSRALLICIAEAAKELLMDPSSWTLFAFNDRFHILKDASEAYSQRVRARIGGLRFKGLTYMPDAIRVAGQVLSQRFDEQRFLIVLSDGWLLGYSNMSSALSESINCLERKGIVVIGVGLKTERMSHFFKISSVVCSQKDLIKRFARIFVQASAAALEN